MDRTKKDFLNLFLEMGNNNLIFQKNSSETAKVKKSKNSNNMNLITDVSGTSLPVYVTNKYIKINLFFDGEKEKRSAFFENNKQYFEEKYGIHFIPNSVIPPTAFGEVIPFNFNDYDCWHEGIEWLIEKGNQYVEIRNEFETMYNLG